MDQTGGIGLTAFFQSQRVFAAGAVGGDAQRFAHTGGGQTALVDEVAVHQIGAKLFPANRTQNAAEMIVHGTLHGLLPGGQMQIIRPINADYITLGGQFLHFVGRPICGLKKASAYDLRRDNGAVVAHIRNRTDQMLGKDTAVIGLSRIPIQDKTDLFRH